MDSNKGTMVEEGKQESRDDGWGGWRQTTAIYYGARSYIILRAAKNGAEYTRDRNYTTRPSGTVYNINELARPPFHSATTATTGAPIATPLATKVRPAVLPSTRLITKYQSWFARPRHLGTGGMSLYIYIGRYQLSTPPPPRRRCKAFNAPYAISDINRFFFPYISSPFVPGRL